MAYCLRAIRKLPAANYFQ